MNYQLLLPHPILADCIKLGLSYPKAHQLPPQQKHEANTIQTIITACKLRPHPANTCAAPSRGYSTSLRGLRTKL